MLEQDSRTIKILDVQSDRIESLDILVIKLEEKLKPLLSTDTPTVDIKYSKLPDDSSEFEEAILKNNDDLAHLVDRLIVLVDHCRV